MTVAWTFLLALAAGPAPGSAAPGSPSSSSPGSSAAARADVPPRRARPARADGDEVIIGRYRLKPKRSGGYRTETDAFIAHIAADGGVSFEEKSRLPGPAVLPAIIVGEVLEDRFDNYARDPLDIVHKQVQRPNLILADDDLRRDPRHGPKMDFLGETADFRQGLQRANDHSALRWLRRQVEELAGDRRQPAARRRQQLFALWEECDETPRGAPARALVEAAARRHFPAGSPEAYSAAELAALNRRAGAGLRFDPYGGAPPVAPPPAK